MQTLNFDVVNTPLVGKNLIEASAGTGKTYSLAVMSVRLIVEQDIDIEQMLLVTFTEKAVAELQIRVRSFIKKAYRYALSGKQDSSLDTNLKLIVDKHKDKAVLNLQKAIFKLDKLNIFTIHGFCQRTLNQYAFYTNETFSKELVVDLSERIDTFSKAFIRQTFYQMPLEDVMDLLDLYKDMIDPNTYTSFFQSSKVAHIQNYQEYIDFYLNTDFAGNDPKVKERIKELQQNPWAEFIINKFYDLKNSSHLKDQLKKENIFTFDDLIVNLKENINKDLVEIFQNKYKVLFIDEFQDTDQMQYSIFSELFKSQITFYIGDPKQAIYSFRNADINTYFKAKLHVDCIYSLDKNFRSAPTLVKAVNELFSVANIKEQYNAFYFPAQNPNISHHDIKANSSKVDFLSYKDQVISKTFVVQKMESLNDVANDIADFLVNAKHQGKEIDPSQVAVLVKTNNDLLHIKSLLACKGVPSVIVNEQKIFESEQSQFVLRILRAISSRRVKDISAVLKAVLFDLPLSVISKLDYSEFITQFFHYYNMCNENGIYDTLMQVYIDFNIENFAKQNIENHVQYWANLNQLAEQLQYVQTKDSLSLEDLIQRLSSSKLLDDQQYQTRVESDENAVQILTIHRSKGLEFDYVFTSDLNFKYHFSTTVTGFYKYYNAQSKQFNLDLSLRNLGYYNTLYKDSIDQENQRLVYVALTRAKYGIFVYSTHGGKKREGAFGFLVRNMDFPEVNTSFVFLDSEAKYKGKPGPSVKTLTANIQVADKYWSKVSFSSLNAHHQFYPVDDHKLEHSTPYDDFVFKDLTKGTNTGHLIHNIFEYLDFNEPQKWDSIIQKSISFFDPNKMEAYRDNLPLFVNQILNTSININQSSFCLSEVPSEKRIKELEFHFGFNGVNAHKLKKLSNPKVDISLDDKPYLHGLLNGLIDLVFEHNGKFYILDWKTNYLGNTINHYNQEGIQQAMTHNNYHLQYCIYSLALKKYLQLVMPDFDYDKHFGGVIYLFVRGMRIGLEEGVFTNFLSKQDIEILEEVFA